MLCCFGASGIEARGKDVLAVLVLDEALIPGIAHKSQVEDLLGALAGEEDDAGDSGWFLKLCHSFRIEEFLLRC